MRFSQILTIKTAVFSLGLLLLPHVATAASAAADGKTFFPPEGVCDADTALMYDGASNVKCGKVIRVLPDIGMPVTVRADAVKSGPGRTPEQAVQKLNEIIEDGITVNYGQANHPHAPHWRGVCKIPSATDSGKYDQVMRDTTCMRFICGGASGKMPSFAQWVGGCPNNETEVGLCGQQFSMHVTCFYPLQPLSTNYH